MVAWGGGHHTIVRVSFAAQAAPPGILIPETNSGALWYNVLRATTFYMYRITNYAFVLILVTSSNF